MKANKNDLINKTFGNLQVISYDHTNKNYRSFWLCKCLLCGKQKIISRQNLISGRSTSCGCQIKYNSIKHNDSHSRLYNIYQMMKERCYNCNYTQYKDYGGRGVYVCSEWLNNYLNFKEWALNNGYDDDLTLDRINVNDIYKPSNCRWATRKEQANNKRYTKNQYGVWNIKEEI